MSSRNLLTIIEKSVNIKVVIVMKKIHIFNPAAGKDKRIPENLEGEIYITKSIGDAEIFVKNICEKENAHFIVHGGDGTISEVVNGIIKAKAEERCLFSVVPKGTGNDFVRSAEENTKIDVIKFNNSYCINSLNTGLDLRVVEEMEKAKKIPFVKGSFAYILGVVSVLFKHIGEKWKITVEDISGKIENFSNEEYSLALFANGSFYGGGFNAAPLASLTDGVIDLIVIKKVSKLTLLKLILAYRAGKHFKDGKIAEKFKKYLIYKKCVKATIENISGICSDGEIIKTDRAEISILKNKLCYNTSGGKNEK